METDFLFSSAILRREALFLTNNDNKFVASTPCLKSNTEADPFSWKETIIMVTPINMKKWIGLKE